MLFLPKISLLDIGEKKEKVGFLHNVVELQHGVRRRIDKDVGQCVLVVVHLVWKMRQKRPSEVLWCPPSSSFIIQYISQEMSPLTTEI